MASVLHRDGSPWDGAPDNDGVAIDRTRRRHEDTYPELARSNRARLLVLGCETAGRWSVEALSIIRTLAHTKAQAAPPALQRAARHAWHVRWLSMVSVAAQRAFAESLLQRTHTELAAETPELSEVLFPHAEPPDFSRLPSP